MSYIVPCNASVSSDFQDHRKRKPPSGEPGTDYRCGYGTKLVAPFDGVIAGIKTNTSGGTGRYLTLDLDDGRRVRWLHLSDFIRVGGRFTQGESLAISGASANGKEWGVGAHVHVSLFPRHAYTFSNMLDFELFIGSPSGGGDNPYIPEVESSEEEIMWRVIESPAYQAAGQRVLMLNGVASNQPAGWVQNLVTHGKVTLVSYPTDGMLEDELNLFYQLSNLSREAAAEATAKLVNGII